MIAGNVDELVLAVSCGLAVGHLLYGTRKVYGGLISYIHTKDYQVQLEIDLVWNRSNKNKARQLLVDFVREENRRIGLE